MIAAKIIDRFIYSITGDKNMEPIIIFYILMVLVIASLIGGIISLIKYIKTKNKLMLLLGIIFTFVIPGILLYFALSIPVKEIKIIM